MVIAASYPFLGVFWDILVFFAWVIFIWLAITVMIDLFRRHDVSGVRKALWVVFIVVLPWIGVLTYLVINHTEMAERRARDSQAAHAQFEQYIRHAAGTGGPASELKHAKELLDNGTITPAEYEVLKAKVLS